ncbi:hypothetical protein TRIATDRAFT_278977 [Trichoderma atroviride IMI 206040]|uniref:Uncharacterized protein n=1 Tax=Hypocrea atroviridis (strain ATCC 20476 / IMI 206040) TaxID=452589 RepID=G9P9J8_HYPAI|nr:uncharacterized protein TRIATDRAFT_278977 [Trichoderma atroviride IMI 206040]EHK40320.1 hypothetical protein TRIATDRAFT_278977 [Trichoderma atroviride IMI 206040]
MKLGGRLAMLMDTAERRNISAAIVDLAGGSLASARVERPTRQVKGQDAIDMHTGAHRTDPQDAWISRGTLGASTVCRCLFAYLAALRTTLQRARELKPCWPTVLDRGVRAVVPASVSATQAAARYTLPGGLSPQLAEAEAEAIAKPTAVAAG